MKSARILVIEDDPDIASLLRQELSEAGYKVHLAAGVIQGLKLNHTVYPDLILLDLGLPDGDGRLVLTRVRRSSDVPVVVLSARDALREKVELLGLGADDYLVKPFAWAELLARIAALLRPKAGDLRQAGPLQLWPSRRLAQCQGQELRLSPKEFDLLAALMRQPGRVVTRTELMSEVWSDTLGTESNVLDVHVSSIRKKCRELALPDVLRTIRGVGYTVVP
jgi:two-component system, OmpR family, copper resistance phosphate regulon response regulator CusR